MEWRPKNLMGTRRVQVLVSCRCSTEDHLGLVYSGFTRFRVELTHVQCQPRSKCGQLERSQWQRGIKLSLSILLLHGFWVSDVLKSSWARPRAKFLTFCMIISLGYNEILIQCSSFNSNLKYDSESYEAPALYKSASCVDIAHNLTNRLSNDAINI